MRQMLQAGAPEILQRDPISFELPIELADVVMLVEVTET